MTAIKTIPEYGEDIQQKYGGQQGAAVNQEFVAFGRDSVEAMENAKKKGYSQDEVMLVDILRPGVTYISRPTALHA